MSHDPEPLPLEATHPIRDAYLLQVDELVAVTMEMSGAIDGFDGEGDVTGLLALADKADRLLWALRSDLHNRFNPPRGERP